jgi:hypothetical protein
MRLMLAFALMLVGFGLGRLSNLPSAAAQASDQEGPITMGPATLRLGMAKDRVLSQFGPGYRLTEAGGSFVVSSGPFRRGGDFDLLGSITFEDGKLKWLAKSWVSDQHNIESFWRGLYGSIAAAIGSQPTTAVVFTTTQPQARSTYDSISIVLKGREIDIARAQIASGIPSYSVDEDFGR